MYCWLFLLMTAFVLQAHKSLLILCLVILAHQVRLNKKETCSQTIKYVYVFIAYLFRIQTHSLCFNIYIYYINLYFMDRFDEI